MEEADDWSAASSWLAWVERLAKQAEAPAALAVVAANAREWPEAVAHALAPWSSHPAGEFVGLDRSPGAASARRSRGRPRRAPGIAAPALGSNGRASQPM